MALFPKAKVNSDPALREKRNAYYRRLHAIDKERDPEKKKRTNRKYNLKSQYGLTPDEYEKMYEAQGGKCANRFCSRNAECIDHDHDTHEVRALLCNQCNSAIGYLRDDPQMVEGMLEYLRMFRRVGVQICLFQKRNDWRKIRQAKNQIL